MSVIDNPSDKIKSKLKDILRDEWHQEIIDSDLETLSELLGI
jgi:hypothetical protein